MCSFPPGVIRWIVLYLIGAAIIMFEFIMSNPANEEVE